MDRMCRGDDDLSLELRPEYDFSKLRGMVQGKYYKRVLQGTNLVRLDPDIAEAFPDEKSVNDALRLIVRAAKKKPSRVSRKSAKQA